MIHRRNMMKKKNKFYNIESLRMLITSRDFLYDLLICFCIFSLNGRCRDFTFMQPQLHSSRWKCKAFHISPFNFCARVLQHPPLQEMLPLPPRNYKFYSKISPSLLRRLRFTFIANNAQISASEGDEMNVEMKEQQKHPKLHLSMSLRK